MITLQELCRFLDELLFNPTISDYCPNGLQIEGKEKIETIATAVSASLATIQAASKKNVDALIVHHGIFWKGDNQVIAGAKREKIKLLLDKNISLFGYHLPLDANQEVGNNWKAARDLGWEDLEPFGNYNGTLIGVRGRFKPIARDKFQRQLEEYYNHPAATALGGKDEVSSAGLISGGAYKEMACAVKDKLDCYVTGNFDEPAWNVAHEEQINFYALGHTATERIGPKALAKKLQELPVKVEFIDIENPF